MVKKDVNQNSCRTDARFEKPQIKLLKSNSDRKLYFSLQFPYIVNKIRMKMRIDGIFSS